MDDKKNLFVIVFLIFFIMTYVQWMFPQQPAQQQNQPTQQTAQLAPQQIPPASVPGQPHPGQAEIPGVPNTHPSMKQLNESSQTVVNTGVAIIKVNHLGGRIQSIKLKNYKEKLHDEAPYEMIFTKDGAPLPLAVYADGVSDDFVLYSLDTASLPPMNGPMYDAQSSGINLVLLGQLATGTQIKKTITFTPGSYAFGVKVELVTPSRDGNPVLVEWTHMVPTADISAVGMQKMVYFLGQDKKLHTTFFKDVKGPVTSDGAGSWIALSNYYFIEALVAGDDQTQAYHTMENEVYSVRLAGNSLGASLTSYAGPKDIESLKAVNRSLERSVDLGMFSFLAHPILALMKFFYKFLHNYGLSIILLTLLIKLAFLPLTQTSFKSMQAMQELQPEIAALRERIQDQNVLNQELMALYKKRGVNPLGGCLPMLIQIPVFLGLYNALLNSIELRHEPFALWITDLSAPEHLTIFGIGIPLMILIMGASMMIQQWTQPTAMDPQQKKIMMMMPFVFTFMFIIHPMPSGLVLYWLVNNLISIVQQKYIRGHKGASPLTATAYASLGMFLFGYVLTLL